MLVTTIPFVVSSVSYGHAIIRILIASGRTEGDKVENEQT